MKNSMLISLSKQTALRRELDIVANNLANLNTTGFKADKLLFEQYIMPNASHNNFQNKTDFRIVVCDFCAFGMVLCHRRICFLVQELLLVF